MDKVIHVDITAIDIKEGCRGRTDNCPIAKALLRATAAVRVAVTHISASWMMLSGAWYVVEISQEAKDFIYEFDKGNPVQPFSMDLTPMTASEWWTIWAEKTRIAKNRPKLGVIPVRPN